MKLIERKLFRFFLDFFNLKKAEDGCAKALAELRHSKWFAEVGQQVVSIVPLIRIMREMCQRVRTWSILSGRF